MWCSQCTSESPANAWSWSWSQSLGLEVFHRCTQWAETALCASVSTMIEGSQRYH